MSGNPLPSRIDLKHRSQKVCDTGAPRLFYDRRRLSRTYAKPTTIVRLHDYDLEGFAEVAAGFGSSEFAYVVTPNVDHLIRFCDDESFRALYAEAGFVLNDSRLLSHVVSVAKGIQLRVCTGADLTEQLFSKVVREDDRIVLVGSTAEQASQLARRYGLRSIKHFEPTMGFINDPGAVDACLRFIEAQSPFRFCFLALGCPQQELLAMKLRERGVARGLTLCIGASINYLTKVERRSPRWMQRAGMEWLFRLLQDPSRLSRRYLIRGPRIFMLLKHIQFELLTPIEPSALDPAVSTGAQY